MIKAIISRADDTGNIAEVGMTNRTLFEAEALYHIFNFAKEYAKNKSYRIDVFYGESIFGEPDETIHRFVAKGE